MSDSSTQRCSAKERPYADYIETTCGKHQRWLVNFLRHSSRDSDWPPIPRRTHIYVLDSIQTVMVENTFSPERGESVDPSFLAVLNNRNADCRARLLIVESGGLDQVNTAYLDAISWHYRLDPLFLCEHLSPMLRRDRQWIFHNKVVPSELPLENKYVQIFAARDDHVTATFVPHEQAKTALLFRSTFRKERDSESLYNLLLGSNRLSENAIQATENNLWDILAPYVMRSLARMGASVQHITLFPFAHAEHRFMNFQFWLHSVEQYQHLLLAKNSLSRFMCQHGVKIDTDLSCLARALQDYESLRAELHETLHLLRDVIQQDGNQMAIVAAEKSLKEADAVRRITLVGMIFIPLNFTTSFFGMNMKQLGSGDINIGYFFLTACLSGLVAFLLAYSIQPSERFWARAREIMKRNTILLNGEAIYPSTTERFLAVLRAEVDFHRKNRRDRAISKQIHRSMRQSARKRKMKSEKPSKRSWAACTSLWIFHGFTSHFTPKLNFFIAMFKSNSKPESTEAISQNDYNKSQTASISGAEMQLQGVQSSV